MGVISGTSRSSLTPATPSQPFYSQAEVAINPGVEVEIFAFAVPLVTVRYLSHVYVSCSLVGAWTLRVAGVTWLRGRTAPGLPNSFVKLALPRPIASLAVVELVFLANPSQPVTEVFGFLEASDQT